MISNAATLLTENECGAVNSRQWNKQQRILLKKGKNLRKRMGYIFCIIYKDLR